MDNICYAKLDSFKRIVEVFKRFTKFENNLRIYEYRYDIKVKTFNTCEKTYILNHYTAFKRNTSTGWRDILYDYSNLVEHCINNEYTLDDVFGVFSLSPENKAKVHFLALLSEKAIQDIIDKNIAAFNKLNNYIQDLFLLKELHLDE